MWSKFKWIQSTWGLKKSIHQYTGLELTTADVQSGQFKVQFNFHPNPNPTRCKNIYFVQKIHSDVQGGTQKCLGVFSHFSCGRWISVSGAQNYVQTSSWTSSKFVLDQFKVQPRSSKIQSNQVFNSTQFNSKFNSSQPCNTSTKCLRLFGQRYHAIV